VPRFGWCTQHRPADRPYANLKRGQFKTRHRTTVITGGGAVGTDPPRSLTLPYVKRSPLKTGPHITVTTRIVSSGNILKKRTEA